MTAVEDTMQQFREELEADLASCQRKAEKAGAHYRTCDGSEIGKWQRIELQWLAQCDALRRTLERFNDGPALKLQRGKETA